MKILKKMTLEYCVFERMDIFFTKYGLDSSEFFERKDVFLTKYGHERIDYFVKNRRKKKGILIFFVYNKIG